MYTLHGHRLGDLAQNVQEAEQKIVNAMKLAVSPQAHGTAVERPQNNMGSNQRIYEALCSIAVTT